MASKEEIIAKTNAAREARKLLRDREAAAIQIQVNNFHKVSFVYHFIKKLNRNSTWQHCCIEKPVKFADKMANKSDFLKIMYQPVIGKFVIAVIAKFDFR